MKLNWRSVVGAAIVILCALLAPNNRAGAFSCDGAWDSSMTGIPSVTAYTTGPCIVYQNQQAVFVSGLSSQSEAWIYGGGTDTQCWQGTDMGSWCKDYAGTATAQAALPPGYFGWHEGWTKHWGIDQGQHWWLFNTRMTDLDAGQPGDPGGDPEEPCEIDQDSWECVSPILIPLTRAQAIKLTSAAAGVLFDLDADGAADQVSWTAADSSVAFLAIDRNGNGRIDDGSELLGNRTVPGKNNGFAALAALNQELKPAGSRASVIDAGEPLMAKLLLWEDRNHNGISESAELRPASDVVADIGLGYSRHNRRDGHGNAFLYRGFAHVRTAPGKNRAETPQADAERRIDIYDVFFVR